MALNCQCRDRLCVLNATYNNISVMFEYQIYFWMKPKNKEKIIDIPHVSDKRYHIKIDNFVKYIVFLYLLLGYSVIWSCHRVYDTSNTAGVTCGTGTPCSSWTPEFPSVFSGVRGIGLFVGYCLSFCTFSFGHCIVCVSSIYGIWSAL